MTNRKGFRQWITQPILCINCFYPWLLAEMQAHHTATGRRLPDIALTGNTIVTHLPPQTVTLFVLPTGESLTAAHLNLPHGAETRGMFPGRGRKWRAFRQ